MKITRMRVNHLKRPMGNLLEHPTVSYVVEDTDAARQVSARIIVADDPGFQHVVYDSGKRSDIDPVAFELPISLKKETRYFWKVWVQADNGERAESAPEWFETSTDSLSEASWITPDADKHLQVVLFRDVKINRPVRKARMYLVGLGLYELYLNGKKQGEECLLPGFCAYDSWIPWQTFAMDLKEGSNRVAVMLGDGWYKGIFGLRKKEENYGDRLALTGKLKIWYEDGTVETIVTDTSWKARKSPVTASGIYPGEVFDPGIDDSEIIPTRELEPPKAELMPRLDPPLRVQERLKPVQILHTPAGETVLDMGQNMTGWLAFRCHAPKGTKLLLQFGELLQDGNFYNKNLRTAKAEFIYISDGQERLVRQHFTYYGFRYVKITGWDGEPDPADFTGLVIYSDMDEISQIKTADPLVNKLYENIKWGQRGNFLDVPTDCPQRDERCGWTGDAMVFSGTACYNFDTAAFYRKYGKDISCEQRHYDGAVPDTVPVANNRSTISTVWGDAAVIIPWNVYLHSGDAGILHQQYDSMKAWVDYIRRQDLADGGKYLWQTGFHYGDWLALDGKIKGGVFGATDQYFIASAFYFYSTSIVARTAKILGHEDEAKKYSELAGHIQEAFLKEYFTPAGRLAIDTMTGYVVALYTGLYPEGTEERQKKGLMNKLRQNRYHLETGFVGTPYLLRVLSDHGMNDMAYHLLLEKGYPGWLYEVKMGATTVWERWDSVLPDGKISGTEMNSLNHYAEGSVGEWMYRDMLGIIPLEDEPGFRKFRLAPKPNYQIKWAKGSLDSAAGMIRTGWEVKKDVLSVQAEVPFNTRAQLVLPDADIDEIRKQAKEMPGVLLEDLEQGRRGLAERQGVPEGSVVLELDPGKYTFSWHPIRPYRKVYSIDSPMQELMDDPRTKAILDKGYFPYNKVFPFAKEMYTFREYLNGPFTNLPYEQQEELDKELRAVQ